jgi:hypothetical protein
MGLRGDIAQLSLFWTWNCDICRDEEPCSGIFTEGLTNERCKQVSIKIFYRAQESGRIPGPQITVCSNRCQISGPTMRISSVAVASFLKNLCSGWLIAGVIYAGSSNGGQHALQPSGFQ